MLLSNKTNPLIFTLVIAAALGPLAMNVFLPSLPGIARDFDVTPTLAQLSVSLYLATVAALQLIFGPLSDKYGRRPIILAGFCVMIIGTLVCIYAASFEWFLFGRVLQAFSSVGLVLTRAIARDITEGPSAASLIAYITMGMSLAPMLGPVFGGILDEYYGWQASFYLTLAFALLALVMTYLDLGETNKHKQGSFREQIRGYPDLLTSRRFWGFTFTTAFSSGAFFAFLGGGSIVADRVFHLSPSQYGLYFMFISIGYLLGNFISGKYSEQMGVIRMMLSGSALAVLGLSIAVIFSVAGLTHPSAFFAMIFFVGLGNGMTLPSANAGVVSVRPKLAGSASGLSGSIQLGGGAALSVLGGYSITDNGTALPLLLVMLATMLCGIASSLYVIHVERKLEQETQIGTFES